MAKTVSENSRDPFSDADRLIVYAPPTPVPFDPDKQNGIKLLAEWIAKHDVDTDLTTSIREQETLRAAYRILRRLAGHPEVPVVCVQAHDASQNIHRILFELCASLSWRD
ncbi:hypothetical protein [Occallatibacter savannae]|uniref:hypothetical protein n=1 Tax=Occallatibacter savannae TaxID=1002691 RepID=UPI000D688433|nr:hypothetical protein [Occallatibacter savannae]